MNFTSGQNLMTWWCFQFFFYFDQVFLWDKPVTAVIQQNERKKKTHHFYCREISADQPWNVVGSEVSSGDPTNRGVTGRVYIYIYMRCKIADYTILYMGFGLTAKTFSVLLKKRRNLKSPSSSFFCAAVVSASQYKSTTNITKLTFADFFFFFYIFYLCCIGIFNLWPLVISGAEVNGTVCKWGSEKSDPYLKILRLNGLRRVVVCRHL